MHVLGRLERGGVENWLRNVLRRVPRDQVAMDFLVHSDQPSAYDREVSGLGARIIPCLNPQKPWVYGPGFLRAMKEHGPYDVVHTHVEMYSGFVVALAAAAGVPVRIAHSHNTVHDLRYNPTLARRGYESLMHALLGRYATDVLACSHDAGAALFGQEWERRPGARVFRYGIDVAAFDAAPLPRSELGFDDDDFVVAHVGSFRKQKNHPFLVEIAAQTMRLRPRSRFVLIGGGPLQKEIEAQATRAGVSSRILFAGERDDVARVLRSCDAFVFPSLHEGLPLSVLEAQAAGLPCLVSDRVTREVTYVPSLARFLPIECSAEDWARSLIEFSDATTPAARSTGAASLRQSEFDLDRNARDLVELYRGAGQPGASHSVTASTR
jgi:glycosyltransferase involved in cell wall biosynthesis